MKMHSVMGSNVALYQRKMFQIVPHTLHKQTLRKFGSIANLKQLYQYL